MATSYGRAVSVTSDAPVNVSPPTISGTPTPGGGMSVFDGNWSGSPTGFTFQWQDSPDGSSWSNIAGATSFAYVVSVAVGRKIRCVVTATNAHGSGAAASDAVTIVSGDKVELGNVLQGLTPVSLWPLSDDAGTTSVYDVFEAHPGTVSGAVTFGVDGLIDNDAETAVSISAGGKITTDLAVTDEDFSVVFFASPVGSNSHAVVAADDNSHGFALLTSIDISGNIAVQLWLFSGGAPVTHGWTALPQTDQASSAFTLTRTGNDWELWQGGTSLGVYTAPSAPGWGADFVIGGSQRTWSPTNTGSYSGVLQYVAFFDRLLSPSEIASIGSGAIGGGQPPKNTTPPVLSGSTVVGHELSVTDGVWSPSAGLTFWYTFMRSSGAGWTVARAISTDNTYTTTKADVGRRIRAVVQASNNAGQASDYSNALGPITDPNTGGGKDPSAPPGGDHTPGTGGDGTPTPGTPPGSQAWQPGTFDYDLGSRVGLDEVWICDKRGDPFLRVTPHLIDWDFGSPLDFPLRWHMTIADDPILAEPDPDGFDAFDPGNIVKWYQQEWDASGSEVWALRFAGHIYDVTDIDDDQGPRTEIVAYSPLMWLALMLPVLNESGSSGGYTIFPLESSPDSPWDASLVLKALVTRALAFEDTKRSDDGGRCGLFIDGQSIIERTADFEGEWDPYTMLSEAIAAITQTYGGCDLAEQPVDDRKHGLISRLHILKQLGAERPNCLFSRGAALTNTASMTRITSGSQLVNFLRAQSSNNTGADEHAGTFESTDSQARYGLRYATEAFPAPSGPTLDLMAQEFMALRKVPKKLYAFEPLPQGNCPEPWVDFDRGDIVKVAGRHRGGFSGSGRIYQFNVGWDRQAGKRLKSVVIHDGDEEGFTS